MAVVHAAACPAQDFVRARTQQYKCRYIEVVPPEHVVRSPRHFISHMWSMPFHRLVQLVAEHVEGDAGGGGEGGGGQPVGVWLDIMAINQVRPGVGW